jgi:hypothetical protein
VHSLGVRVRTVFDLEPRVAVVFISPQPALRHNSFQIMGANFFKHPFVGGDADATDQRREAARLLTLAAFGVWSKWSYRFRCVPLEKVSK